MLHSGIHKAYAEKMQAALNEKGVKLLAKATTVAGEMEPTPSLGNCRRKCFFK
jgi:alpha-ketoglutaric semialdehyde dehydrogenase